MGERAETTRGIRGIFGVLCGGRSLTGERFTKGKSEGKSTEATRGVRDGLGAGGVAVDLGERKVGESVEASRGICGSGALGCGVCGVGERGNGTKRATRRKKRK